MFMNMRAAVVFMSSVKQVHQRQSVAVPSASVSLPLSSGVEQGHQRQSSAVQSASVSLPLLSGVVQVRGPPASE